MPERSKTPTGGIERATFLECQRLYAKSKAAGLGFWYMFLMHCFTATDNLYSVDIESDLSVLVLQPKL